MTSTSKSACIYGFDPGLQASLKEILYFAGAEPFEVEDVSGLSKIFKTTPPDVIVMSLEALEMLDFHVMVGSDPQFDRVAIIAGIRDINTPQLRSVLETCATDFFLVSQPYHLKRLAMAVMAMNPWSEVPVSSGKLLLADANLERRIAIARSLRIAKFDVEFAESPEDLLAKIGGDHPYRVILSAVNLGQEDSPAIFGRIHCNREFKLVPWLIYETGRILANTKKDAPGDLVKIGSDLSPETVSFHVQNILASPMKELRKSERVPYYTPVKVIIERIREEIWGFSTDMSENGLYIRTLVPPPPGTMLTIAFRPPTAEGTVQMGARVAWRKEYGSAANPSKHPGFGIEFARISEPDRAALLSGYAILQRSIGLSACEEKP
jgi:CheY-like chemotaxis protein